jgi:hypothetical protein
MLSGKMPLQLSELYAMTIAASSVSYQARRDIPAISLADHDSDSFRNRFYQSFLDNAETAQIERPETASNLWCVAKFFS